MAKNQMCIEVDREKLRTTAALCSAERQQQQQQTARPRTGEIVQFRRHDVATGHGFHLALTHVAHHFLCAVAVHKFQATVRYVGKTHHPHRKPKLHQGNKLHTNTHRLETASHRHFSRYRRDTRTPCPLFDIYLFFWFSGPFVCSFTLTYDLPGVALHGVRGHKCVVEPGRLSGGYLH